MAVPPFNITEQMLELAASISEVIGSIKSTDSLERLPRLRKVSRIKSIHASLAIEENMMTFEQTRDVINGKNVIAPKTEILEVKNAFEAYSLINDVDECSLRDLLRVHGVLTRGLAQESGMLRTVNEGVIGANGEVIHVAPPSNLVPKLMEELFDWLKNSKTHALIKSSVFHYELEFIHPFRDGNGRIGRLWQSIILTKWKPIFEWIAIESIIKERQAHYYNAIAQSTEQGNSNRFIVFMLEAILEAAKTAAVDTEQHISHIDIKIQKLLQALSDYPPSALELMGKLGLKSRDTFRNNYLAPAIRAGLVGLTDSAKPTSKNQRYFRL